MPCPAALFPVAIVRDPSEKTGRELRAVIDSDDQRVEPAGDVGASVTECVESRILRPPVNPVCLEVARGNVFVTDFFNDTVRRIAPDATVNTIAGAVQTPGLADGPGDDARFDHPWGIATDDAGNVYVSDVFNSTIRKITIVGPAAAPAMVPTLSEWSLSVLASLLGIIGAIALRRSMKAPNDRAS